MKSSVPEAVLFDTVELFSDVPLPDVAISVYAATKQRAPPG